MSLIDSYLIDNFVPHSSVPLPVPLSLSLIPLEAGVAVHVGSDRFAPLVQQQNVILPLGDTSTCPYGLH